MILSCADKMYSYSLLIYKVETPITRNGYSRSDNSSLKKDLPCWSANLNCFFTFLLENFIII